MTVKVPLQVLVSKKFKHRLYIALITLLQIFTTGKNSEAKNPKHHELFT